MTAWGIEGNSDVLDGPAQNRQRLTIVDFTKQWIEWPVKVDLVWCVEVLEHVPAAFEDNVLKTIAHNAGNLVFIAAAPPTQLGRHVVRVGFYKFCQSPGGETNPAGSIFWGFFTFSHTFSRQYLASSSLFSTPSPSAYMW